MTLLMLPMMPLEIPRAVSAPEEEEGTLTRPPVPGADTLAMRVPVEIERAEAAPKDGHRTGTHHEGAAILVSNQAIPRQRRTRVTTHDDDDNESDDAPQNPLVHGARSAGASPYTPR